MESGARFVNQYLVFVTSVVEGRKTLHGEGHRTPDHIHPADQLTMLMPLLTGSDRHEVNHFRHTVRGEEASH